MATAGEGEGEWRGACTQNPHARKTRTEGMERHYIHIKDRLQCCIYIVIVRKFCRFFHLSFLFYWSCSIYYYHYSYSSSSSSPCVCEVAMLAVCLGRALGTLILYRKVEKKKKIIYIDLFFHNFQRQRQSCTQRPARPPGTPSRCL